VVYLPGKAPLSLKEAWASPNFERLRASHRARTWDDPVSGEPICRACAVTKLPTRIPVQEGAR
jgi:hypothetical protein